MVRVRTGRKPGQTALSTRRGMIEVHSRDLVAPWDREVSPGFRNREAAHG